MTAQTASRGDGEVILLKVAREAARVGQRYRRAHRGRARVNADDARGNWADELRARALAVADPQRPGAHREVGRHTAGAERPGRARALIHTGDRLVVGIEHPGRALPDGDARRRPAYVDRRLHPAALGVEQHERIGGRRGRRRALAVDGEGDDRDGGEQCARCERRGEVTASATAARRRRVIGGGLRARQRRVLLEHALVQRPQRLAGLDPELLDEPAPPGGERLQRLRLAPRAVQREHQLAAQALAQRMLDDQRLELGNHLAVLTGREPGLDMVLDCGDPQLLEAADRFLRERLVAHVRQSRPTPEAERVGKGVGRLLRPARGEMGTALRGQLLETRYVELAGRDAGDVATSFRDDHAGLRAVGLEHLAQLGHVPLQRRRGRRRSRPVPDEVDQPVAGNDLVGVQQQDRQHAALARPAQRRHRVSGSRLDRAEEPEVRSRAQSATVPPL